MSHAIAVVAHKARSEAAHALKEQVGAQYLAMDNGTYGVGGNHRRCWEYLAEQDSDYSVVLEDDAIPCEDFNTQITKVLAVAPTPIVSLYLGSGFPPHLQPKIRNAVAEAEVAGASFIIADHMHGVGVAIKTDMVADMLAYTSTQPFDYHIRDWARTNHHRIAFTMPSLIDHRDEVSVHRHPDGARRTTARKAYKFGGRGTWTTKTVEMT